MTSNTRDSDAMRAALLAEHIELNMSNYGPDDVDRLNAWAIEAYDFIARAASAHDSGQNEREAIYQILTEEGAWLDTTREYYERVKSDPALARVVYAASTQASTQSEAHKDAEREAFKPVGRCECAFSQDECEVCESNRAAYQEWKMENETLGDQFSPHRLKVAEECCERLMSACTDAGCPDGVPMDDWIRNVVARAAASAQATVPYRSAPDCPYVDATEEVKCAWADGWNQCTQFTKGSHDGY
jgi:ribosome modulation factor